MSKYPIADKKIKPYSDTGVNIDLGDELVNEIKPIISKTNRIGADTSLEGFGGCFDLSKTSFKNPVLIAATDGVGTKLEIAQTMNMHYNIGIDLVAMCVNDVLSQGAEPLFFLDYFASNKLNPKIIKEIIEGIVEGCIQSGAALIGGETAEMPGIYNSNIYDVAGFCVGAIERESLIKKTNVKEGNIVLAYKSSGVHSNGFSLIRKLIKENNINLQGLAPYDDNAILGNSLLIPTKIYANVIKKILKFNGVNGIAHITGGGLITNPPRAFSNNLAIEINLNSWKLPKVFSWLKNLGSIPDNELLKVFNCGIGMLVFVNTYSVNDILKESKKSGEDCFIIGTIIKRNVDSVIFKGDSDSWGKMEL